jgi:hypothetical protein
VSQGLLAERVAYTSSAFLLSTSQGTVLWSSCVRDVWERSFWNGDVPRVGAGIDPLQRSHALLRVSKRWSTGYPLGKTAA